MRTLISVVLGASLVACSGGDASDETQDDGVSALSNPNYGYFVAHQDMRKCAAPMCGGFFVHRVNSSKTLCADGSYAAECYVASIDLSGTGLNDTEQAKMDPTTSILRGKISKTTINKQTYGMFGALEIWVGQTLSTPVGSVYRAKANNIKCIKAPCPTVTASKLDTNATHNVVLVDLDHTANGANSKIIAASEDDIVSTADGLIVAGSLKAQKGGGDGLVASEFYRLAKTSQVLCGSKGTGTCATDEYCAYRPKDQCGAADQPGVCTARPQVCYQLYKPVCGCDGMTYGNACFAAAGGTSTAYDGACQ